MRPQGSPQNFQVAVDLIQRDRGRGETCLDNHGVSQRKQMNKSTDGEVKCLDLLHRWQCLHTLYGRLGSQAREVERKGRDPEKAQTKFKMTAYIRMDTSVVKTQYKILHLRFFGGE